MSRRRNERPPVSTAFRRATAGVCGRLQLDTRAHRCGELAPTRPTSFSCCSDQPPSENSTSACRPRSGSRRSSAAMIPSWSAVVLPRIEPRNRAGLFEAIHGQRRDHIGIAADCHHHRLVGRLQRTQERLRRLFGQPQRLARHAPAAIHAERHRQRELSGGEGGHFLQLVVLVNLEVFAPQPQYNSPFSSVTVVHTSTSTPDENCATDPSCCAPRVAAAAARASAMGTKRFVMPSSRASRSKPVPPELPWHNCPNARWVW